jgi:hypothetical protein
MRQRLYFWGWHLGCDMFRELCHRQHASKMCHEIEILTQGSTEDGPASVQEVDEQDLALQ